ncbi:protease Do-like protein 7 [Tanacetum coccineum]
MDEMSMEIDPPTNSNATSEDWRNALKKVVPTVVVLRTTATRAFDTQSAASSYDTGFVVDKTRGIILTNRHVVKPGPVVAEAMFVNREEIPIYPVYRDPVHDFGFFRYDPAAIHFLSYEEIPLAPEAACVGLETRVVGNDSGEKRYLRISLKFFINLL